MGSIAPEGHGAVEGECKAKEVRRGTIPQSTHSDDTHTFTLNAI